MSRLKDHLYSAGAGVAVGAGAVLGAAVVGAAGAAGLFVAGATLVAGAAVADAVAFKAETFKPLSTIGGAGLSLAAAFSTAYYLGLDHPLISEEHTGKKSTAVEMIASAQQCSDVGQAFNIANNDTAVTASMDAQGDCVLTVNPQALALS